MENSTVSTYKVKTNSFEGPFNLLLSLIEERKLFINEVSLASVTEEYITHVNELENTNKEEMSSFITVVATLILIKSKSLLPDLKLTNEEESDIKILETRLREYEKYLKLSEHLKKQFGRAIIFARNPGKMETLIFIPDARITPNQMMVFAHEVLGKIPKQSSFSFPDVEVKKVISLEEMINNLTNRIQNAIKLSWSDLHSQPKTKEEKVFAIVSFLAMLELIRSGLMEAIQENNFEEIILEKREQDIINS